MMMLIDLVIAFPILFFFFYFQWYRTPHFYVVVCSVGLLFSLPYLVGIFVAIAVEPVAEGRNMEIPSVVLPLLVFCILLGYLNFSLLKQFKSGEEDE